MKKLFASLFITALLISVASCNSSEPSAKEVEALQARLRSASAANSTHSDVLKRLYESRGFKPVWVVRGRPLPRIESLVQVLNQAPAHGLNASDYVTPQSPPTPDDPVEYELQLTAALIDFGFDLAGAQRNVEAVVRDAINNDAIASVVNELAPKQVEYRNLQQALQSYQGPPEDIEQIKWTMKYLRTLPDDLGKRYIRVNIPEYRLAVIEDGKEVLGMNVVVGKVDTPTPIFSDDMTHIVFSPYWNIPESILTNETLPKALVDSNYLSKQNIEVVRVSENRTEVVDPSEIDWSDITHSPGYSFRQKPGAANALGLVKFMFPNKYNVYLHDTPADSLFARDERHFSHGCIRVEQPLELAKYLLRDQPKWSEEKINAAMHSGDENTVKLTEHIPVHIMYMTAWTSPDGAVHVGKDIYDLQKKGQ